MKIPFFGRINGIQIKTRLAVGDAGVESCLPDQLVAPLLDIRGVDRQRKDAGGSVKLAADISFIQKLHRQTEEIARA